MVKDHKREVHLELLLGRRVHDRNGKAIGRIEEVRAEEVEEQQGDEMVVREFLIGRDATLERLSAWSIGRFLLRIFGAKAAGGYRVSWDKLDLTDAEHPRLTCAIDELRKFSV